MKTWLSAHLHCNGQLDILLADFVYPLTQQLYSSGLIESFFFIRYAEKGPHIRLRCLVANDPMKVFLIEYISLISQSYNPKHSEKISRIEFVAYQPEIERYGNHKTIHLAEQMFNISSHAVLKWLSDSLGQADSERLTIGLLMHTCFMAVCLRKDIQIPFLDHFTRIWLPEELNDRSWPAQQQGDWTGVFQRRYEQYLPGILSYIDHYYDLASNQAATGTDWLDQFVAQTIQVHQQYHHLVFEESELIGIYQSFMHMTNNRLGIANHDEPFLSFLLSRSLKEINDGYGS